MSLPYSLSHDAEEDLIEIFLFGDEKWGIRQARLYQTSLYELFQFLADNPKAGRVRSEIAENIRSFAIQAHTVFYTVIDGHVVIVRVLRGSMDIDAAFMPSTE